MKKIAACFILLNLGSAALWAMPSQITFQGTLKQNGVPVNTTENMQFSFVDNTGATIPGTQPITINNVSVINGLFAANLPIPSNIAWDQYSPYVRVAVQGQILSPDQPINANLYSLADATPPGTVVAYAGQAAPVGWLLCDGSAVSATTYSRLFNAIGATWGGNTGTFNLPDLRGRAPIGAGQGSGLTTRTLGDTTIGEEMHKLTVNEMPSHTHAAPAGQSFDVSGDQNNRGIPFAPNAQFNSSFNATAPTGGDAPHNIMQPSTVVNFIIKY